MDTASVTISTITVYILEARKEFSSNLFTEQELVSIKLKLVIDINGEKTEVTQSGEFYNKTLDASNISFDKLFKKSIKDVVYNSLKNLKR